MTCRRRAIRATLAWAARRCVPRWPIRRDGTRRRAPWRRRRGSRSLDPSAFQRAGRADAGCASAPRCHCTARAKLAGRAAPGHRHGTRRAARPIRSRAHLAAHASPCDGSGRRRASIPRDCRSASRANHSAFRAATRPLAGATASLAGRVLRHFLAEAAAWEAAARAQRLSVWQPPPAPVQRPWHTLEERQAPWVCWPNCGGATRPTMT